MPQLIAGIIALIVAIYVISLILTAIGWISVNLLILIERAFYIKYVSPLVSWSLMGLLAGLVLAFFYEAPKYGKTRTGNLAVVIYIFLMLIMAIINTTKLSYTPNLNITKTESVTSSQNVSNKEQEPSATSQKESETVSNIGVGMLYVTTSDTAKVLLDGKEVGVTNIQLNIKPGTYKFYIEVPEFYKSKEREIVIKDGELLQLTEGIPDSGIVTITSSSMNDFIEINGERVGKAPLTIKLPVGKHVIREGEQEKEIIIQKNSKLQVVF